MNFEILEYIPEKKSKNAAIISGSSVFLALFIFIISANIENWRIIYHFTALIFATFGMQILARFVLSDYVYRLEDLNFIVIKINGKKTNQVCNVNLETAINLYKAKFAEAEKDLNDNYDGKKIAVRMNFCQNFMAEKLCTYVFEFNGRYNSLAFEPDENFINQMQTRINYAKNIKDFIEEM